MHDDGIHTEAKANQIHDAYAGTGTGNLLSGYGTSHFVPIPSIFFRKVNTMQPGVSHLFNNIMGELVRLIPFSSVGCNFGGTEIPHHCLEHFLFFGKFKIHFQLLYRPSKNLFLLKRNHRPFINRSIFEPLSLESYRPFWINFIRFKG